MEYGSEFDSAANAGFISDAPCGFTGDGCQLYRSGRDAMKALSRIVGRRGARVLLPALCCESMILPFTLNGYETVFYRLNDDLTGSESDVLSKLTDGAVLLYIRYFGIRPFSDGFLQTVRDSGRGILCVEDRTHDIIIRRRSGGFIPDATLASLRKWAALPDGGMLQTDLGVYPGTDDRRFAVLRREAMEKKRRYLASPEPELKRDFLDRLHTAERMLDESGEPVRIGDSERELLMHFDFDAAAEKRIRNVLRLRALLTPLHEAGRLRFLSGAPENSTLYFPILLENRDAVQKRMAQRDIYCPVIWPMPEQTRGVCPVSERTVRTMLAIPCDQRYGEDDMRFIAKALIEILSDKEI